MNRSKTPLPIYLDNAATSFPKPAAVGEAMARFLAESAANPGRAGHRLAVAAERMIDDLRLRLARLVGGNDPNRLIFTLNGTDALNLAIRGVLDQASSPTHVITTTIEHNSVSRPLQRLAEAGRIQLTRVDCDAAGVVDPDDIGQALRPTTRLVAISHASNVLGTVQDVAAVGRIVREHGAMLLVDAAQTIGLLPIDVEAMAIDLLAFPGHKALLGPTGTGALHIGARAAEHLEPMRTGGTGGDSSSPLQPRAWPYRLEAGTPNTVGLAGLAAAVDGLDPETMHQRLAHERSLCRRLRDRLADCDAITCYGPVEADRAVGAVALNLAGLEPADAAAILDQSFNIAVRPGLHCAPYLHQRLGTAPAGTIRVSPGPFTTDADIDTTAGSLREIGDG